MDPRIQLHDRKGSEDAQQILRSLVAFNQTQARKEDWRELTATVRDERGELIAGLNGHTDWTWLFVKLLWVSEAHRRQGLGRKLLQAAEEEALRRGCRNVWLDTFEFQARGFYEKLGYEVFGELPDYPPGFRRFFLRKKLPG
jgi:GNAT superfamily N-acetyltransferase